MFAFVQYHGGVIFLLEHPESMLSRLSSMPLLEEVGVHLNPPEVHGHGFVRKIGLQFCLQDGSQVASSDPVLLGTLEHHLVLAFATNVDLTGVFDRRKILVEEAIRRSHQVLLIGALRARQLACSAGRIRTVAINLNLTHLHQHRPSVTIETYPQDDDKDRSHDLLTDETYVALACLDLAVQVHLVISRLANGQGAPHTHVELIQHRFGEFHASLSWNARDELVVVNRVAQIAPYAAWLVEERMERRSILLENLKGGVRKTHRFFLERVHRQGHHFDCFLRDEISQIVPDGPETHLRAPSSILERETRIVIGPQKLGSQLTRCVLDVTVGNEVHAFGRDSLDKNVFSLLHVLRLNGVLAKRSH
mmetsp:Transcript_16177/g.43970  ORF Transcript_16177/g.43970 Transcript_16177/m.43970 type:complete len:363 (-) Transcript_16177:2131-3219(-)